EAHLDEAFGRAPTVASELAVESEDEPPRSELADEELPREILGGDLPQPLVERQRDRARDPRAAEELETVLEARQRARRMTQQHRLRVMAEGDDRGDGAERLRVRDVRREDRLVPEMDAVEHAD